MPEPAQHKPCLTHRAIQAHFVQEKSWNFSRTYSAGLNRSSGDVTRVLVM